MEFAACLPPDSCAPWSPLPLGDREASRSEAEGGPGWGRHR